MNRSMDAVDADYAMRKHRSRTVSGQRRRLTPSKRPTRATAQRMVSTTHPTRMPLYHLRWMTPQSQPPETPFGYQWRVVLATHRRTGAQRHLAVLERMPPGGGSVRPDPPPDDPSPSPLAARPVFRSASPDPDQQMELLPTYLATPFQAA